jgi:phosphatidylglycerol:prolipoprotein diacylglycerol transferase
VEFVIHFLSPAWMGTALVGSLAASVLAPARLRRWWLICLAGIAAASMGAWCGFIPWFGLMHATVFAACMVSAFVIAYVSLLGRARLLGVSEKIIIDLVILALIGGIVGARLGEVWEQWPRFAQSAQGQRLTAVQLFAKAADIDGGGMVWYGGAFLATLFIVLYAWRARLAVLELADLFLPTTLLGLGIGRVGCFFNGCCYGRPTTLPWAVAGAGGPRTHPTQLYETLACITLFGLLMWWWYRRRVQGQIALASILGYALWRSFNESLRGDTVLMSCYGLFTATTSQVLSLHIAIIGLVAAALITWRRHRNPRMNALAHQVPGSRYDRTADPLPASTDAPAGTGKRAER